MSFKNIEIEAEKVFTSRVILLNQLKRIGYNIDGYDNFSIIDIERLYKENQLDLLLTNDATHEKICVKYFLNKTLKPEPLNQIVSELFELSSTLTSTDTLYLVLRDEPNEALIHQIIDWWNKSQIFIVANTIDRMKFDVTEHDLVPRHVLMNSTEVEELKKQFNIEKTQHLPSISRFDPQAKAICLRPGQICRIERSSKTAIINNYYRVCENAYTKSNVSKSNT